MAAAAPTATVDDDFPAAVLLDAALLSLRGHGEVLPEANSRLESALANSLWIAAVQAWELLQAGATGEARGLKEPGAEPALAIAADAYVASIRSAFPRLSTLGTAIAPQLELVLRELRDQAPAEADRVTVIAFRTPVKDEASPADRTAVLARLVESLRRRGYDALSAALADSESNGAAVLLWNALDVLLHRSLDDDPLVREQFHTRLPAFIDEDHLAALLALSDAWRRWPRYSRPAPVPSVQAAPLPLDENVQFTVYRPDAIAPMKWSTLLAFAHLTERRPEADPEEPDPVEEMERQAADALETQFDSFQRLVEDTRHAIPQRGVLTFVPTVAGVQFNPPRASFEWTESVHKVAFRMRAEASLEGKTARGDLSVFLGGILVADLQLALVVNARRAGARRKPRPKAEPMTRYRRIFASYAHLDAQVVGQIQEYARALGDEYLMDAIHLRSGEVWSEKLCELIERADVFQLFWSWNSMSSEFVRKEWEHALSLGREQFVRPTYWQLPMPAMPEKELPPAALARLHFQRISTGSENPSKAAMESLGDVDQPPPSDPGPANLRKSSWVAKALSAATVAACAFLALSAYMLMPVSPPSTKPIATSAREEPMTPAPPTAVAVEMPEVPSSVATSAPLPKKAVPRPKAAGPPSQSANFVTVTVLDAPPGTRVTVDGVVTRLPIRLPKDGWRHQLVFTLPSGDVTVRSFVAERDQVIRLRPDSPPPATNPNAKPRSHDLDVGF